MIKKITKAIRSYCLWSLILITSFLSHWAQAGEAEVNEIVFELNSRGGNDFLLATNTGTLSSTTIAAAHLNRLFRNLPKSVLNTDLNLVSNTELLTRLHSNEKGIYEIDDRIDWPQFSPRIKELANSVAAMVNGKDVRDNGDGTSTINTCNFGEAYSLCANETFFSQPIVAFGTAFLVKSNVVCTALHCIRGERIPQLDDIRLVFDFKMISSNRANTIVLNSSIVGLKSIHKIDEDFDVALVTLNGAVSGREPLKLRGKGRIEQHQSVTIIGYPCGLPVKFSEGAYVKVNTNKRFFEANLDAFGGNSGSPVFGVGDLVEGVLVGGEKDFVKTGSGCLKTRIIPSSGIDGERCSRITRVSELLTEPMD